MFNIQKVKGSDNCAIENMENPTGKLKILSSRFKFYFFGCAIFIVHFFALRGFYLLSGVLAVRFRGNN